MSGTQATARPGRVLHVLKYYRPAFTGEGVFLERSSAVMQELAPAVEHDLLVTHTPRPAHPEESAACSTLRRVEYLTEDGAGPLRRELLLLAWLARHLHRYDTVHFRTHADWYFAGYALIRAAGRRLVLSATLDDSLPVLIGQYRPRLRPLAERAFRLFQAYVAISPKLMTETRTVAIHPERAHLIPCGVSVPPQPPSVRQQRRAALGAGPGTLVLLFVGGLCRRKDPLTLIEALPAILARHADTRLVLVGPPLEPDYVAELEERIATLGLGGRVHFTGEQLDPHPWFAASDVLVFASRLEGFGTVVPEAMAHGRPVVVRRLPGVNDSFVLEGETGFLFDAPEGLVDGVARLAADPALRARMGAAGQALAREQFGMRGVGARYLTVYGLADRIADVPPPDVPETGLACTASIPDRRFHVPVAPPPVGPPLLLTTIDTEESFDWSAPFSRDATDVAAIAQVHRAHRIFARHGVKPIYLVDYPVAAQDAGRGPLRELLADGVCEIGAHMHPWVTPPFEEEVSEHNSFAGNLPPVLEYEKTRRLTEAVEDAFGLAPRMYRTGRFGPGARTADILKRLGYLADSSIAPCWPPEGFAPARDTWSLSARPHWVDRERALMQIPMSAALVGRLAGQVGPNLAPLLFNPLSERTKLTGALSRLGLLERIRLSPEGVEQREAQRLARHMLAAGHRVFVLSYHAPSLAPGNTPYVRNAEQLARFLGWLDEFYAFFREELGGRFGSWRDVRFPPTADAAAPLAAAA